MGRARENAEVELKQPEQTEQPELEKELEQPEQTEQKAKKEFEYLIEAPNKSYNGVTATVKFEHGIGKTKNKVILDYFKARNYKISVVK